MQQYSTSQIPGRIEDRRLVSGHGCFVDDLAVTDALVAVFLRSPHAHARILAIDVGAARRLPGVLGIYTGADWVAQGLGPIPTRTPARNTDGSPPYCPSRPALAVERVRFVGDALVMIVALDEATAIAAHDLIEVEYEPLPAVTDPRIALDRGAEPVWPEVENNLCVDYQLGDAQTVDEQFAKAAHIARVNLVNQRVTAVALETRGALGEYDPTTDRLTLTVASQNIHAHRQQLAADVFRIDPQRLRVRAVDVGGGFGVKNALYPEYALVLWAARELARPVKWISSRSDSFSADSHGREQYNQVELALGADGEFLALRVETIGNTGAYVSTVGPFVASGGSARTQGGPYRLPAAFLHSRVAFTNTAPTDPYRGAGRPEATYIMERVVDVAARQLGIDPYELRRRNVLRPEELPYRTAMGAELDSGDFPALLERAGELGDRSGFAQRAARSRAAGKLRGFGYSLYFECTGGAPKEYARLSFDTDGVATLAVGTHATGTGHETVFCRMVADRLGLDPELIRFIQADTDATPIGGGHGGSRSMELGGVAVQNVIAKVVSAATALAADHLEVSVDDIEFSNGRFSIAGTDRFVTLTEMASAGAQAGTPLDQDETTTREQISYPAGCHVAEVEIDRDTGVVQVVRYTAVDDFGRILNHQLADGQVMGGAAQGIGQVLQEQIVYDDSGQLLTGTLMDYSIPRADDLPNFMIDYIEHAPTGNNALGVKGAGEAGCVGALAAVVNAAVDALVEFDCTHLDMPLSPERVWRLISDAKRV